MYPQPVLTLTMLPLIGKDRRRHVYLSQSGYDMLTGLCAGDAVTGPQGPVGPQGPAGPEGPAGPQGAAGSDGMDGAAGATGPTGPQGPAGATGPEGPQGVTGDTGAQGAQGPAGPTGPQGSQGIQGPPGAAGAQGPQGPAGADGADGADGNDGAQGPTGPQGATGPQGPAGDITAAWPVGAIFISAVSTNPATLLGFGTWSAFGAGRVLVGRDGADTDFDTAEETGGAKSKAISAHAGTAVADHASHTHTYTEVPNHVHVQTLPSTQAGNYASGTRDTSAGGTGGSPGTVADALSTANPTGGVATGTTAGPSATLSHNVTQPSNHSDLNVVQPYIVVYMWKRTA